MNRVTHDGDVTRHVEVVAISPAQKTLGTASLDGSADSGLHGPRCLTFVKDASRLATTSLATVPARGRRRSML